MPPGPEHLELSVGQLTFDALAVGPADGELVLLLHGFPQSSHEWRAQLGALGAAGYRAVAPDQRGYSPRARPAGVEHYRAEHPLDLETLLADGQRPAEKLETQEPTAQETESKDKKPKPTERRNEP